MLQTEKLTHKEVAKIWPNRESIFQGNEADLLGIKSIDSSGVAFLVLWAKSRSDHKLIVRHSTHQIRSVIRLFKVESLFDLQDKLS